MKAVKTNAIITSLSSKKDGSLGLRVETPELTTEEKVIFFELQGINVEMWIKPLDVQPEQVVEIVTDKEILSPSQRLRNLIFVIYKETNSIEAFSQYYEKMIDRIMEGLKKKYLV